MAKNIIVDQITKLSQEEGLNDFEIGEVLGYARGSIQRIRKSNNIGKAIKQNRKDKACKCMKCDLEFFVRRIELEPIYCPDCEVTERKAYNKMLNDKLANQ